MSRMSMKTPEGLKCDQCGMIFSTEGSLQKHKEKFCIGLPDSGNNRDDLTIGESSIDLPEHLLSPNHDNISHLNQTLTANTTTNPTINNDQQATFYLGSPQPKAQSPVPDLQPKPQPRKLVNRQNSASALNINNNDTQNNEKINLNVNSPVRSKTPANKTTATNKTTTKTDNNVNNSVNKDNKHDDKQTKAIEELHNFKAKRSIEQSVKDMEDLIVRDTLRDKKLINSLQSTPNNSNSLSKNNSGFFTTNANDPYRVLLKEYSELKQKEKLVLKEVYDLNNGDTTDIKLLNDKNNLSESQNPDSDGQDKENIKSPINTQMLPSLATTNILNDQNQRYLKQIQSKTLELERERKDIQQKLELLKADDANDLPISSRQSINRILSELKDQERINEAALDMLKKRILKDSVANSPNRSYISSNPTMYSKRSSNNSFTKPTFQTTSYLAKPYGMLDDSLSPEEIRSMRMNYLQSGGHDSSVLARFTEMEYLSRYGASGNTQSYNYYPSMDLKESVDLSKTTARPKDINLLINDTSDYNFNLPSKDTKLGSYSYDNFNVNEPLETDVARDLDDKIRKVETENKRLQMELEYLQDKYRNLNYGGNNSNNSLELIKRYDYDQNLERVKLMLYKYDKYPDLTLPPISSRTKGLNEDVPNLVLEQRTNIPYQNSTNAFQYPPTAAHRVEQQQPLMAKLTKLPSLNAAPYDPIGGFVIFIDFVTSLDPSIACSRVITCLHHPKSGLGEPSILPLVNCETYIDGGKQSTVALISTKQPVPRCPPQQALTILIELQLATKEVNESKLRSCAWTKIPLFDYKNRLLSGRWKMPLKTLPIKSDANLLHFSSYQSFNEVEFYYRLVNARDSDEQTNAPISPAYADQYHLPPQNELPEYNTTQSKNQSPIHAQYQQQQQQPIPTVRQSKNSLQQDDLKQKIDPNKRTTVNASNLSTNSVKDSAKSTTKLAKSSTKNNNRSIDSNLNRNISNSSKKLNNNNKTLVSPKN